MPENKIDQQRFDAIQELAQIEMKLSDARVAFENLKKAEEEYLKQREDTVVDRLTALEKSLSDAFSSVEGNKKQFEKIKGIISSFSEKAVTLAGLLKEVARLTEEKIFSVNDFVNKKMGVLKDQSDRIRIDREELDKELEVFSTRLRDLDERERSLNFMKVEFEKKWSELNK